MRQEIEDGRTIKRYLLGELSGDERRRLEERLLDEGDDFFEQLLIAEEELADEYVGGELSVADRARFEQFFLSTPERREQLGFAATLRSYVADAATVKKTLTAETPAPSSETPAPSSWLRAFTSLLGLDRPAVGFSLACVLLLAVAIAAWLGLRTRQLSLQLDQLQAQQHAAPTDTTTTGATQDLRQQLADERAQREQAAQELRREQERRASLEQEIAGLRSEREVAAAKPTPERTGATPEQSARRLATPALVVPLTSGLARSDGTTTAEVSLKPATRIVRLLPDVAGDDAYKTYRAVLETVEGEPILTKGALRARATGGGQAVRIDVPARILKRGGDYQLRLEGVRAGGAAEEVGKYYFRVAPR